MTPKNGYFGKKYFFQKCLKMREEVENHPKKAQKSPKSGQNSLFSAYSKFEYAEYKNFYIRYIRYIQSIGYFHRLNAHTEVHSGVTNSK